jgi:hypothetical protein
MPNVYRTIFSYDAIDNALPRDAIQLTPWFLGDGTGDFNILATGIRDAFCGTATSWLKFQSACTVKIYRWNGENVDMGPPVKVASYFPGMTRVSNGPRDVAVCLSYYADQNVPRWRGRLYLPFCVRPNPPAAVPAAGDLTDALAVGTALGAAGGAPFQWVVYSHVDTIGRPVTNAWCDNEFDTQRRRGTKASTRALAAITA